MKLTVVASLLAAASATNPTFIDYTCTSDVTQHGQVRVCKSLSDALKRRVMGVLACSAYTSICGIRENVQWRLSNPTDTSSFELASLLM